jgi:hypothetical protein
MGGSGWIEFHLHLPDSKTGPKSVPMGAAAAEILAGIPRVAGNPWTRTRRGAASGSFQVPS